LKNTNWIKTSIIFLIVTFIALEIGVRLIHFVLLKINNNQYQQYAQIYSDERDKDYLFFHKPNVDWLLNDGYYNFRFQTNKYGHRSLSDKIDFEKSIVFVGDSIIEGASVENNQTLPYLVQEKTKIPSINLGVGSSNTVQEYLLLKDKIQPSFNMKKLVLGFCLNDIDQNLYRRAFNPSTGNWEYFDSVNVNSSLSSHNFESSNFSDENKINLLKRLLQKSEAFMLIYRLYRHLGGARFQKDPSTISLSENWKNTEYFIKLISNLAEESNSKFYVIIFPNRSQLFGNEDFSKQIILKSILEKNNIKYFDASIPLLKYLERNKQDVIYHDEVHPNALGTKLIAEGFVDFLYKN